MQKTSSKIISWISILFLTTLLLLTIAIFYKFEIFNIYYAKVIRDEDNSYVVFNADEDFINMRNRNFLVINEKDTRCHLIDFSDNYTVYENNKYWEVSYTCELPDELNINDNIVKIRLDKGKTTLFKMFIKKLKRGIENARVKN